MKKIGILTSGGDAPGMNGVIRSVVRAAHNADMKVEGVHYGYEGLVKGITSPLGIDDVGGILHRGGTILKTARSKSFKSPQGFEQALDNLERLGIDVLVVVGGNGSLRGCYDLQQAGKDVIFIPGTIDNDLGYTEFTLGYDTAVNTVISLVNNIRDTGSAHDKSSIIEVMGRECGDLALRVGLSVGADCILIPEFSDGELDRLRDQLVKAIKLKKWHHIIIRSEGAKATMDDLKELIKETTGEEPRIVIPGYIQRGGSPSATDRMLGTLMGARAVDLIEEEKYGRAIGNQGETVIDVDIEEAHFTTREANLTLLKLMEDLS